jgi:hypothetical protein
MGPAQRKASQNWITTVRSTVERTQPAQLFQSEFHLRAPFLCVFLFTPGINRNRCVVYRILCGWWSSFRWSVLCRRRSHGLQSLPLLGFSSCWRNIRVLLPSCSWQCIPAPGHVHSRLRWWNIGGKRPVFGDVEPVSTGGIVMVPSDRFPRHLTINGRVSDRLINIYAGGNSDLRVRFHYNPAAVTFVTLTWGNNKSTEIYAGRPRRGRFALSDDQRAPESASGTPLDPLGVVHVSFSFISKTFLSRILETILIV